MHGRGKLADSPPGNGLRPPCGSATFPHPGLRLETASGFHIAPSSVISSRGYPHDSARRPFFPIVLGSTGGAQSDKSPGVRGQSPWGYGQDAQLGQLDRATKSRRCEISQRCDSPGNRSLLAYCARLTFSFLARVAKSLKSPSSTVLTYRGPMESIRAALGTGLSGRGVGAARKPMWRPCWTRNRGEGGDDNDGLAWRRSSGGISNTMRSL